MKDELNKTLSDQDVFDLFMKAKEQYEKYLEVNSFNEFAIFNVQEESPRQIHDGWEKPLDLCLFKEKKDAFME